MADDFLFHKVNEKERKEIKKQAKQIMDSFSKRLSKIGKKIAEPLIERAEGEREESGGKCSEIDRKIMFDNAPEKNEGFIVAEKGGWK